MVLTLPKKIPVEIISLHTPMTSEWDSPYCQFVWFREANGSTRLWFAPPRVQIRVPPVPGPVRCLLFHSALLDSADRLPASALPIPVTEYLGGLLDLLNKLCKQPAAELLPYKAAGLLLCLIHELPGGIRQETSQDLPRQPLPDSVNVVKSMKGTCIGGRALIYAVRYMYSHLHNPLLSLQDIAQAIGYHPNYFCHEFSKIFKQSPIRYLNDLRLRRTVRLLKQTDYSVKAICKLVGVARPNKLCAMVKAATSMTPTEYRRSNRMNSLQ